MLVLPSGRVLVTHSCRNIVPMDLPRYGITFQLMFRGGRRDLLR